MQRRARALVVLGLCLAAGKAAAASVPTTIIDDPLTGELKGQTSGQQVGGAMTPEGYKPKGNDHILYVLPEPIEEGELELEVRGMKTSVRDADPAFFVMYDGRGITEPCTYSEWDGFHPFRENYFRFNVHWRAEHKAMKLVLITAKPRTADKVDPVTRMASYHRPTDSEGVREFVVEPMDETVAWDPSRWHKLRTVWRKTPSGGTTFTVTVDAKQVLTATSPHPYRPREHRVWIGSGPGKYAQTTPGITFRNVKLTSFGSATRNSARTKNRVHRRQN